MGGTYSTHEMRDYKNVDIKIWSEVITREPCRRYKNSIKLTVKSNCVCVCVRARERDKPEVHCRIRANTVWIFSSSPTTLF